MITRVTLLVIGASFFQSSFAQTVQSDNGEVSYTKCIHFEVSKPLSELAEEFPAKEMTVPFSKEIKNKRPVNKHVNQEAMPQGEDPALQKNMATRALAGTIASWQGQSGTGYPPDPSGAAGTDHYVQAVNTSYRVYSKTGGGITGTLNLSSLWSGSDDDGDPIVMYDKYADRWFISQFQTTGNKILIAISTSPDPKGTYYKYTFVPNSNDFPDYPKYSIWADGYYMTANFGTKRAVVFERDKMLTGDPAAGMIVKNFPSGMPSSGFFSPLPADADGQLPPFGTPCYLFSFEDDSWSSGNTDQIRIYKMTTNWTSPSSTTITLDESLPTQAFNSVFTSSWDDIAQKGTSDKLDGVAGVFNYRAQFRRWTGYNSVVLCHVVKVSTNRAGIRWYELRQDDTSKEWSIYQQSTYSPDSENRWLGSIAMDDQGDIGIAYAVSGTNTFPSLRYTGRLATDPLNEMTFEEQTGFSGNSAQTGVNRFGDYSHTSLDPDGATLWHTGEYIAAGVPRTRIFSFRIADPAGVKENSELTEIKIYQTANMLNIEAEKLSGDEETVVDLFDLSGRLIAGKKVKPIANSFRATMDVSELSEGTYLVRVGNGKFQKVVKVVIH